MLRKIWRLVQGPFLPQHYGAFGVVDGSQLSSTAWGHLQRVLTTVGCHSKAGFIRVPVLLYEIEKKVGPYEGWA